MRIGGLELHCGDCGITEYCGKPLYSVCVQERFDGTDEDEYMRIAESAPAVKDLPVCEGCKRPDCDETCEYRDDEREYTCEQIADYVYANLGEIMPKHTCYQCGVDDFDADEGRYNECNEFICDNCAELNKEQHEAYRRGLTWAEHVYGR